MSFFRGAEALAVLLAVRLQLALVDLHTLLQGLGIEHQVFDLRALRLHPALLRGGQLVIGRHVGIAELDLVPARLSLRR
ncbi:MAG: hypothetical protein U1E77_14340 [Inhella sp.]